jgi:hypothetical protein
MSNISQAVIHLGNSDSTFPNPNAPEVSDEECARCIAESRPWPPNNQSQPIDQCLHYLEKIFEMIKPHFKLIKAIFVPPMMPHPMEREFHSPGVVRRSHERSAFYIHKMVYLAESRECEIVGISGSPPLQHGIEFSLMGQEELADELRLRILNCPVQPLLNTLEPYV